MCPKGVHISPPAGFEGTFDHTGNSSANLSNICTTCPLFIGELLQRMQTNSGVEFRCYRKYLLTERWKKSRPQWGDANYGDLQGMVIAWFQF